MSVENVRCGGVGNIARTRIDSYCYYACEEPQKEKREKEKTKVTEKRRKYY